jgi:hypothetical protein
MMSRIRTRRLKKSFKRSRNCTERLDDKDDELDYKRCTIDLLELELMEFNADNSKFLLEYELVE